ncbi:TBC domain-containing protein [Metarhizium album ARSEF 1941]|uniref:TBC domain-containing protein n=1 Tax=Metarhizium album (strain ARSEF 1941) TaxID=1081103 RepID=A0A0B2WRY0_METAS|nr:TBC domain-containing protein [Metarhizium album ARSEF 1941]KHN96237.1 TBC domain-containing protein [Metarhizium album ARSEF 1941]
MLRTITLGDLHRRPDQLIHVLGQIFLLSTKGQMTDWVDALEQGRKDYTERSRHFLKFIRHPEALTELTVDPLADDPDSPWNTLRQDEIIRTEIQQDVQRLPDEVNYHKSTVQAMILDVLFVYCKVNPDRGGYRQGMHELLAPIIYALQHDSIDAKAAGNDAHAREQMLHVLDSDFVEHDAYIMFSKLMEQAQSFYEVTDGSTPSSHGTQPVILQEQRSAIVDRSKFIHQVCLQKVDPELAAHLTNIDVLPQIFLIRWIRLLFSREFPLEQLLVLWDTIFAVDSSLKLIDLICVAMLVRIRWQLLEADYTVCLQLLLKYPPPEQPNGPHTFVDDAMYLRDHLDPTGGSSLIMKYSGKIPNSHNVVKPIRPSRDAGPERTGRQPKSPSRLTQHPPSMEAFFQGAARSANRVLERSEKLGISQAVRDAMGEIRRNVQSFNEARQAQRSPTHIVSDEGVSKALAAMERRNKELASLLNDTVTNLKTVSLSEFGDKAKSLELIEVAAAKIQFVQIYLEDSTMDVPVFSTPRNEHPSLVERSYEAAEKNTEAKATTASGTPPITPAAPSSPPAPDVLRLAINEEKHDSGKDITDLGKTETGGGDQFREASHSDPPGNHVVQVRPAPVPTRSTLAQSSFSWMLEPDETASFRAPATSKSSATQHSKKHSSNLSRERNAFLFGEIAADAANGNPPLTTDDIFGMEPIATPKGKAHGCFHDE